jgi:hypothetical protein
MTARTANWELVRKRGLTPIGIKRGLTPIGLIKRGQTPIGLGSVPFLSASTPLGLR